VGRRLVWERPERRVKRSPSEAVGEVWSKEERSRRSELALSFVPDISRAFVDHSTGTGSYTLRAVSRLPLKGSTWRRSSGADSSSVGLEQHPAPELEIEACEVSISV
jgi:hypothetical protein